MRKIILSLVLLFFSTNFAQFQSNRFYLGLSAGIAHGVNANNEKTVPSYRIFLQHRIIGNWLFGQFGVGYTKLQAKQTYWARTAYIDERLLIVPYSTEYFLPYFGAGIGVTKAVYSTGTSYLGYSPLFAGIQTRLGENIVLNTYGGFALSFSDSLDGRARNDQNLNPVTNNKQDGFWFWEAGLQFGFPNRKNKSEPKESPEDFPEFQEQEPISEPAFEFESALTDSLPVSPAPDSATAQAPALQADDLYRTIGFTFGGANLSSEAIYVLRVVADSLKNNPSVRLRIVGHADNQGSPQGIEKFAMARAVAVRDWLLRNGIAEDRLETSSAGAREPRADNKTHEGRLANRRVELWVVSQ